MKAKLDGKLALVTGAGSGIGRATTMALAEAGARVVVTDIDEARVDEVARALGAKCALAKRVDVARRDEMKALAADVHAALGPLDVLVNNAGVGHSGGVLDTPLEDWDWVVGVNMWGVIHGCHFFVPGMVERGAGGHVVNVASLFGLLAAAGVAPYCASKFAVVGLTESLRAELAPHGIGVSAVCPGMIATDIIRRGRFADEGMRSRAADTFAQRGLPPERVARAILGAIRRDTAVVPVGRDAWAGYVGKRLLPGVTARVSEHVERRARKG